MPAGRSTVVVETMGKECEGYKFRRQYSVGTYVVDFYCAELKLAIEIDGESHFTAGSEDVTEEGRSSLNRRYSFIAVYQQGCI